MTLTALAPALGGRLSVHAMPADVGLSAGAALATHTRWLLRRAGRRPAVPTATPSPVRDSSPRAALACCPQRCVGRRSAVPTTRPPAHSPLTPALPPEAAA